MSELVKIDYTNWRGVRSLRIIRPVRIFHGANVWHPNAKQWLLEAWDSEKGEGRYFSMKDIHSWKPADTD